MAGGLADYSQFIYGGISDVGDTLTKGLADREKSRVLSGAQILGPDGKPDYPKAIQYLLQNNQLDAAKALAPIAQAQAQHNSVFGTPIYGVDPRDGSTKLGTFDHNGVFRPIETGPNFNPTVPTRDQNLGTSIQTIPSRLPTGPGGVAVPGQGAPQPGMPQAPPRMAVPPGEMYERPVPQAPPQAQGVQPPFNPAIDGIPPSQAQRANPPQPGSAAPIQPTPVPTQVVRPGSRPGNTPIDIAGKEIAEKVGQGIGTAQVNLPQVLNTAGTSLRLIEDAIKHPGREAATGLSGTFDPRNYVSGTDAKNYQVRHKQLEGRVFLDAFDQLRGAGAITEAEGQKATIAHGRLALAQSDAEYLAALKELKGMLIKGVAVTRLKAQGRLAEAERVLGESIPDVTVTAPPPSATPRPGQSNIDDLVKKYSQ